MRPLLGVCRHLWAIGIRIRWEFLNLFFFRLFRLVLYEKLNKTLGVLQENIFRVDPMDVA